MRRDRMSRKDLPRSPVGAGARAGGLTGLSAARGRNCAICNEAMLAAELLAQSKMLAERENETRDRWRRSFRLLYRGVDLGGAGNGPCRCTPPDGRRAVSEP